MITSFLNLHCKTIYKISGEFSPQFCVEKLTNPYLYWKYLTKQAFPMAACSSLSSYDWSPPDLSSLRMLLSHYLVVYKRGPCYYSPMIFHFTVRKSTPLVHSVTHFFQQCTYFLSLCKWCPLLSCHQQISWTISYALCQHYG